MFSVKNYAIIANAVIFFWFFATVVGFSTVYNYESTGSDRFSESFVPVDDVELQRFVRQLSDAPRGTLKRQYSQFNEDNPLKLPENIVPINKDGPTVETPANVTGFEEHHIYYNVTFLDRNATDYFVDLDRINESVVGHEGLSKSHLKAAGIQLSFPFPFYGYTLSNLTLATGGFLYTGNPDHNWIAATQYIAPLMADFDFLVRNDSEIRYYDNGTALTIEWKNALLHERKEVGPFTFQVTLHKDGTIIFYYQKVPISITNIPNETHPVKVGVSDAYMIDRQRFIIRYRTIYEYHRIALHNENIANDSAFILKALPTCIGRNSCDSCLHSNAMGCMWCDAVNRCSDGIDRFHQEWHSAGCAVSASNSTCNATTSLSTTTPFPQKMTVKLTKPSKSSNKTTVTEGSFKKASLPSGYPVGGRGRASSSPDATGGLTDKSKYTILTGNATASDQPIKAQLAATKDFGPGNINYIIAIIIVSIVTLLCAVVAWVLYAYMRPQTPSGQWLIKYRPNQWRWHRDDEIQIASTTF